MDETLKFTGILLVEDNPYDVEMVLHTFKKHNITNRIHVVRDVVVRDTSTLGCSLSGSALLVPV